MLFHVTTDDHIRIINEQGPAETDAGGTFATEQELSELAKEWPTKRLVAIWTTCRECTQWLGSPIGTDLARDSDPNRSRSSEGAAHFQSGKPAGVSRGLEGGASLHAVVATGRRHAERDPKPNWMAGPYRAWVYLPQSAETKPESALV